MTPRKPFSSPYGSCTGTRVLTEGGMQILEGGRKAGAFAIQAVDTTNFARCSSVARAQTRSVCTSTPATASTTTRAASVTRSVAPVSLRKLPKPGVSTRLTLVPCQSSQAGVAASVCLRAMASSSKSVGAVPSSTRPSRVVAPAVNSRAEMSWVLPEPLWPTTATLRMDAAA